MNSTRETSRALQTAPSLGGAAAASIRGLRVLLVEDEFLVAALLEDMLADFGCIVAAVAATVADAIERLRSGLAIDAAVLDVKIGADLVFPVADALERQGVPFLFSTGFGPADLAERYPDRPVLHKPYPPELLASGLADVAGSAGG